MSIRGGTNNVMPWQHLILISRPPPPLSRSLFIFVQKKHTSAHTLTRLLLFLWFLRTRVLIHTIYTRQCAICHPMANNKLSAFAENKNVEMMTAQRAFHWIQQARTKTKSVRIVLRKYNAVPGVRAARERETYRMNLHNFIINAHMINAEWCDSTYTRTYSRTHTHPHGRTAHQATSSKIEYVWLGLPLLRNVRILCLRISNEPTCGRDSFTQLLIKLWTTCSIQLLVTARSPNWPKSVFALFSFSFGLLFRFNFRSTIKWVHGRCGHSANHLEICHFLAIVRKTKQMANFSFPVK